jgi:hypothetical protein
MEIKDQLSHEQLELNFGFIKQSLLDLTSCVRRITFSSNFNVEEMCHVDAILDTLKRVEERNRLIQEYNKASRYDRGNSI